MKKMIVDRHSNVNQPIDISSKTSLITKKLQMNIPQGLHKRFKLACTVEDTEMTSVVIELISEWLDRLDNK